MAESADSSPAITPPPAAEMQQQWLTISPRSQNIYSDHFNHGGLHLIASRSCCNNNNKLSMNAIEECTHCHSRILRLGRLWLVPGHFIHSALIFNDSDDGRTCPSYSKTKTLISSASCLNNLSSRTQLIGKTCSGTIPCNCGYAFRQQQG